MKLFVQFKHTRLCAAFCIFLICSFYLIGHAEIIPSGYDWGVNPGTGGADDPYQIATSDQLISLGANPTLWDRCFVLTADLTFDPDLAGDPNYCNFNIIGHETLPFSGVFDGQGHQIENLVVSGSDNNVALFGFVQGVGEQQAFIKNLTLVNPVISGVHNIGALAGYIENAAVENCHIKEGTVSGVDGVGGLVGSSFASSISLCSASDTVSGNESVGGLVGFYDSAEEKIFSSFATGDVLGQAIIGGLVGYLYHATVDSCYARGAVTGDGITGALIGYNEGVVLDCYASGSVTFNSGYSFGIIGDCYCDDYGEKGVVFDSYWNTQTSGIPFSPYGIAMDVTGIGLTTDQMQSADTYGLWGSGEWVIDDGNDYPHLVWEGTSGEAIVMFGGGTGTKEDPYLITGPGHLFALSYCVEDSDKHFALANDIIWDPNLFYYSIGFSDIPFTGTFDGRGHQIEDFTINDGYGWINGLFGYVQSVGGQSAVIKDLILTNPVVSGGNFTQRGSLVSYAENAIIENCHVIGGTVSGNNYIGGLVGYNEGSSITMCSSTAAVNGNRYVGGLVGKNVEGQVENNYVAGAVSGQEHVGGLVGMGQGVLKNCYALGSVTGVSGVGGLIGDLAGELWYCYAAGAVTGDEHTGGLYGQQTSIVMLTSCFWDVQTTGIPGGYYDSYQAKTTGQMKSRYTYSGWGNGLWVIDDGVDYPHLVWEGTEGTFIDDVPPIYAGGSGTADDPYQISTAQELFTIGYYTPHLDKHFILTDDIFVIPEDNPSPIGTKSFPFTGSFNGQGHEIHDLAISRADDAVGLFGYVQSNENETAAIENLRLINPTIEGYRDTGGIAGYVKNVRIENCHVISGAVVGQTGVGGLVGDNNASDISYCSSSANVTGTSDVGGLTGVNYGLLRGEPYGAVSYGTVSYSYATGTVTGRYNVGGLVGANSVSGILHCYASGIVTCTSDEGFDIGGLAGENDEGVISLCYAAGTVLGGSKRVGGLIGVNYGRVVSSFWDVQISGLDDSDGGEGKTTAEMKSMQTFVGWGDNLWILEEGNDYPHLAWEQTSGQLIIDASRPYGGGTGTAETPYRIDTFEHLQAMNDFPRDWDRYFVVTSDIVCDCNIPFLPIGCAGLPFKGSFDGQGHQIRNLTLSEQASPSIGFFGYAKSEPNNMLCVIKDLQLVDPNIPRRLRIGCLTGCIENARIENCHIVSGDISGSIIGGLVGCAHDSIIESCSSGANVSGGDSVGGLVGIFSGTISSSFATGDVTAEFYIGGLVGECENATIESSYATGTVTGRGEVGGLVGDCSYSTILSCHATGAISGDYGQLGGLIGDGYDNKITSCYATGTVEGGSCIGGLLGDVGSTIVTSCYATGDVKGSYCVGGLAAGEEDCVIFACYATGAVYGENGVGGLVGINEASVSYCYATGPVFGESSVGGLAGGNGGEILYSYSTGNVSGNENLGGLVGSGSTAYVLSSYWDIQTSGISQSDGGDGKTTEQMQSLQTYFSWGDNYWVLDDGNDYPHLVWEGTPGILIVNPSRRYGGGSGTVDDPFHISTLEHLSTIRNYRQDYDKYFVLVNDIYCNPGELFFPIGTLASPFTGSFDGANHSIENIMIQSPDDYVGLFGYIDSPSDRVTVVKNLRIINPNITGMLDVGALAGYVKNGYIINCHINSGTIDGWKYVGGLMGEIDKGEILMCSSSANVIGDSFLGGIVGSSDYDVLISLCKSVSVVSDEWASGGLVGLSRGTISHCYTAGTLDTVGGRLVGYNNGGTILSSYSKGILLDYCNGYNTVISDCYYLSGTTPDNGYGMPLADAEMKTQSSFAGWDFVGETDHGVNDIWRMCEDGIDYPRLSWELGRYGDFTCPTGIGLDDLILLSQNWLGDSKLQPEEFNYACDTNGDGKINIDDFHVLAENWIYDK